MTLKAYDMYQGDGWLTYRATVAQAFDTLDRLREICQDPTGEEPRPYSDRLLSTTVVTQGSGLILKLIAGYCDELTAELNAVLAELFPSLRHNPSRRWIGFEMQFHLRTLMQYLATAETSHTQRAEVQDETLARIEQIGDCLKCLDQ